MYRFRREYDANIPLFDGLTPMPLLIISIRPPIKFVRLLTVLLVTRSGKPARLMISPTEKIDTANSSNRMESNSACCQPFVLLRKVGRSNKRQKRLPTQEANRCERMGHYASLLSGR